MRSSILPRLHLAVLAVAMLLGACASSGSLSAQAPSTSTPCGSNCKGVMLAMAYTANLSGSINLGNNPDVDTLQRITATTGKRVDCALSSADVLGKDWSIVWGPVVVLKPNLTPPSATAGAQMQIAVPQVPANTVFVAKQNDANVYVIAIAGTNPVSIFDWKDEDFDAYPVPWGNTAEWREIFVTRGTQTGLGILQGMRSGDTTQKTLLDLVTGIASGASATNKATIYITGHSLGGALAPALGLWLADQKSTWDPQSSTTLQVYSFAGATPGSGNFAKYVHKSFPGGDGQNDMVVVDNSLDVVPHAFNLQTLQQLDTLYLQNPQTCTHDSRDLICIYPSCPAENGILKAIIGSQKAAGHIPPVYFATLGEGSQVQGFSGALQSHDQLAQLATGTSCPLLEAAASADDYAKEAIYQHICAYPLAPSINVPTLNTELATCRHQYPNG